eukprot:761766-Hanusia_phi.AAC.4
MARVSLAPASFHMTYLLLLPVLLEFPSLQLDLIHSLLIVLERVREDVFLQDAEALHGEDGVRTVDAPLGILLEVLQRDLLRPDSPVRPPRSCAHRPRSVLPLRGPLIMLVGLRARQVASRKHGLRLGAGGADEAKAQTVGRGSRAAKLGPEGSAERAISERLGCRGRARNKQLLLLVVRVWSSRNSWSFKSRRAE